LDSLILTIVWNSFTANNLIDPMKSTGEIFGLPSEACNGDVKPGLTIHHNDRNPNWDFTPWLQEKLSGMHKSVLLMVEYWLIEIETFELNPNAPMTKEEFVYDMIQMNFREFRRLAKVVFEELCNDNLNIIEHD
jgi:hypothetical protein